MEVSYLQPAFTTGPHVGQNTASTTVDDVDDMDIDLGPIDEDEAFQLVNMPQMLVKADDTDPIEQEPDQSTLSMTNAQNHDGDQAQVPIADSNLTPHKIHIRGVDDFTTEILNAFISEHLPLETPPRIEWIDDTSANIVFDTPATASKALEKLTYVSSGEPFSVPAHQLRPAKIFSKYPQSSLQVRLALSNDRKRPRAYEASRFYMMHPEHDPREHRRYDRSREDGPNDYRRRRYGRDEHRRRKSGDNAQGFKPSMYDDDASALASRESRNTGRRGSFSMRSTLSSSDERSGGERHIRHTHCGDSYRPGRHDRSGGTSRDRSASPGRVNAYTLNHSRRMSRRRTPPPPYQSRDPHPIPLQNQHKELFPLKSGLDTASNRTGRELLPHKTVSTNLTKELFPNKSITISHRRSDAFDAADETADLFASRLSVPFAERENSSNASKKTTTAPTSSFGRLRNSDLEPDPEALQNLEDGGISIRGVSKNQAQGFSIRGAADGNARNGLAKELFPGKALGNAGKELFVEKIHGRGGRRNRAEDMFY